MKNQQQVALTESEFAASISKLTALDEDLSLVVEHHGSPPFWIRDPGFATLVRIILEQQVSLASARAACDRLLAATAPLTPESLLTLDNETLRGIGFSRQKASYARGLAEHLRDGRLDLTGLANLPQDEVYHQLLRIKGIGPWSAQVYLLMALRRPDIWPTGDLALVFAMQEVKRLPQRPSADEMVVLAKPWRPWRAVAARILWHFYLSTR